MDAQVARRNGRNYDRDNAQSGVYGTPLGLVPDSTAAVVANRVFCTRFTVSRPMTILSGSFGVSVAANTDDSCDIGIYDATLLVRLASMGVTAGLLNTVGRKVGTLMAAVTLQPRTVYYSCFIGAVAGTAATLAAKTFGVGAGDDLFGATTTTTVPVPAVPHAEAGFYAGGSATLGSGGGTISGSVSAAPVIAWREF